MPTSSGLRLTKGMVLRMLADAALIQFALIAGLSLRLFWLVVFENDVDTVADPIKQFRMYFGSYCDTAWPLTSVCLVVFYWFGFYTYGRYYQGRYKALVVSQAVCLSYVLFAFSSYFLSNGLTIPRAALALSWGFTVVLLVGARLWSQAWQRIIHPEREAFARGRDGTQRRILVIGGAGYIGSALLPKLLEQGHQVRLLDMLLFGDSPIQQIAGHPNLEVVQGDFRHVENVVEAMRDVDSVIHLGAIVGDPACSLDEDLTIDVNLSATRMIAEFAKASGVDRFIFASTCSVYGACDELLDERSLTKPVGLYGYTKLASERLLRAMANERFSPTIVRFATIYGFSGRTRFDLVINLLAAKAKIDGEITVYGGDQWRPFVHVDDAARAVALILNAPHSLVANETFNVGSNEQNYTIRDIGTMIRDRVVGADLVISDNDSDLRNYRVDFSKIRNLLGFEPQWTVDDGIRQVLDAITNGEVTDYRDAQYSNVKFLTESGTTGLARNNWARELLRELSSQ